MEYVDVLKDSKLIFGAINCGLQQVEEYMFNLRHGNLCNLLQMFVILIIMVHMKTIYI